MILQSHDPWGKNIMMLKLIFYCMTLVRFVTPSVVSIRNGQSHRNLIVGGQDARSGKYPYFGAIEHFAGGVLIAPDILLTAGHVNPPLEQNAQVRLNHTHFLSTNFALEPVDKNTFGISAIVQYPDYSTISVDESVHDFNIFVLDGISDLPTVKLNRSRKLPRPGQQVTVVGFGSTSPDPATFVQTAAKTLQEVNLTVLSYKACLEQSGGDPARPGLSYNGRLYDGSMICTSGGPHNEKDACAFDSGSPLLVQNRHGETVLTGLVSWGENCADPYFPAVNARVSFAMPWVDRVVCALSKAKPEDLVDFGCDSIDQYDDDDDYYWAAQMLPVRTQFRNYEKTYTAKSGTNAILALAAVAAVGIGAVVLRLANDGHPNSRLLRRRSSMMRQYGSIRTGSIRSSINGEEKLLSMHPAKASLERSKDLSPQEIIEESSSVKSYETFL